MPFRDRVTVVNPPVNAEREDHYRAAVSLFVCHDDMTYDTDAINCLFIIDTYVCIYLVYCMSLIT